MINGLSCYVVRRERDSNPRYPFEVYTLSRRAPSTTRTPLLFGLQNYENFAIYIIRLIDCCNLHHIGFTLAHHRDCCGIDDYIAFFD